MRRATTRHKRVVTQNINGTIKWRSPANHEPDLFEHDLASGERCGEDSQAEKIYEFLHRCWWLSEW
jgi:hypothetical protein